MDKNFLYSSIPYNITAYEKEGEWYLSANYLTHDDSREYKVTFPRIKLGACLLESYSERPTQTFPRCNSIGAFVDLGFGELEALYDDDGVVYSIQTMKRKMTMKDIEEMLGYKVEIIDDKGESV